MPNLVGQSTDPEVPGVIGESQKGEGVRGISLEGLEGAGVVGKGSPQGSPAGRFDGNVNVVGTVNTTHVSAQGNISAVGNVNAGDTVNTMHVSALGNINVGRTDSDDGSPILSSEGHIVAQGNISALGNINSLGNLNAINLNVGRPDPGDGSPILRDPEGHIVAQGNISALGNVNAKNMNVTGDIILAGADCAEEFEVDAACAQHVTAGTVVVFDNAGLLRHSLSSYDKRVAGVVSGAGDYKPGIILDRRTPNSDRIAVALLGKVFCNVDATYGSVEVGDLLTTSDTPGHAMKASDPARAFGAVIGKALRPLREGQGSIPILIALQ